MYMISLIVLDLVIYCTSLCIKPQICIDLYFNGTMKNRKSCTGARVYRQRLDILIKQRVDLFYDYYDSPGRDTGLLESTLQKETQGYDCVLVRMKRL